MWRIISTSQVLIIYLDLYIYDCVKKNLEPIRLFSMSNKVHDNMLDYVFIDKYYNLENDLDDFVIKVGYFVVMNDDDLICELHRLHM